MVVQIFTIPGCSYCVKVKQLLERANLEYIQTVVGKDISRDKFKSLYPEVTGFPLVNIDGENVGGLVETAKYLLDKGLVKTNKRS